MTFQPSLMSYKHNRSLNVPFSSSFLLIDCFSLQYCFLPCEFLPWFNVSFKYLPIPFAICILSQGCKETSVLQEIVFKRELSLSGLLFVIKHGRLTITKTQVLDSQWGWKQGISALPSYSFVFYLMLAIVLCVCKMADESLCGFLKCFQSCVLAL